MNKFKKCWRRRRTLSSLRPALRLVKMDFFGEMDTNSQHVVSHFPILTRTLLEIDISLLSFFLKVFTAALTFRSFDTIWSILDILLIYSLFWLARTSCIRLPIKCNGPKLNLSTSSIEKKHWLEMSSFCTLLVHHRSNSLCHSLWHAVNHTNLIQVSELTEFVITL